MVALRDELCGVEVGRMEELGAFAEEIVVYGCAYLEEGKRKYRISTDQAELYAYVAEAVHRGIWPTPVVMYQEQQHIGSSGREEVVYAVKRRLARQLQAMYPPAFFELLKELTAVEAGEGALPFLQELREALEGRFIADELQVFAGLLEEAYQVRQLQQNSYERLWKWLVGVQEQMQDETVVKEHNAKTWYGLVSRGKEGRARYVINVEKARVLAEKESLLQQGIYSSPILEKTFWYTQEDISTVRQRYEAWLQGLTGEKLLIWLDQLHALPPMIEQGQLQLVRKQAEQLPVASQQVLNGYLSRWGCEVAEKAKVTVDL